MSLTLLNQMYDEAMKISNRTHSDYDPGMAEGLKKIFK